MAPKITSASGCGVRPDFMVLRSGVSAGAPEAMATFAEALIR